MKTTDISQSLLNAFRPAARQGASMVGGFFRRVLTHTAGAIIGIVCAVGLGPEFGLSLPGKLALIFATYVGVINLLPGIPNYLASGLSIALALLLVILGTPWQTVLFWAGGTTLLIRLLMSLLPAFGGKGQAPLVADRPRSAIVVYAVAAALLLSALSGTVVPLPPVWPFIAAVVAALALRPFYGRFLHSFGARKESAKLLIAVREAATRLAALPGAGASAVQLHALADTSRTFIEMLPAQELADEDAVLLRRVAGLSEAVRSTRLEQDEAVADAAQALNSALEARRAVIIADAKPKPVRSPAISNEQMDKVKEYSARSARLREQARTIAPALREQTLRICDQADKMLDHVTYDARNFSTVNKFLNRYLDAAEKLLSFDEAGNAEAVDSGGGLLAVSGASQLEAMLVRLADAFSAQYGRMLQDNNLDLRVELGVLDKLLKMDGH